MDNWRNVIMDYILDDTESVLNFLHVIICADVEERFVLRRYLLQYLVANCYSVLAYPERERKQKNRTKKANEEKS